MKKTPVIFSALLGTLLFICSCAPIRKPLSSSRPENNSSYEVHYLFEHDGVKLYKFYDYDNTVYFTVPVGVVTAVKEDSVKTVIRTISLE